MGKLPTPSITPAACDTITYTKHIKPIIETWCISCHGTTPSPGAPMLVTYEQVKNNAQKIKNTVFDSNPESMPQGGDPLEQDLKDLITCWLNNGNKE